MTKDPQSDQTLLVRVSGKDQPGITAGILHILEDAGAGIIDIEQVVLRDRLSLGLLIRIHSDRSPLKDLLLLGWERGVDVDFEIMTDADPKPYPPRFAVTVLGNPLAPKALGAVTDAIVAGGGNIERITRLSIYPVISFELIVLGGDLDALRTHLLVASSEHDVDVAIQREGLSRRAKRLVVIDMDSTLIQGEMVDLLAQEVGVDEQVRALTEAAMTGQVDFSDSLRERVALLEGLTIDQLDHVWERIRLTPGAATFTRTLHRLGYTLAIVSGGFSYFADRLAKQLSIELSVANELEILDGKLTGRMLGDIIDGPAKAETLVGFAASQNIPIEQTVAIGDGANDLEMLSHAGLGIAFNARPVVEAVADTTLRVPYLDAILFMLGIRREDVEEADRAAAGS